MRDNPRLFINSPLGVNTNLELSKEQAHYIHNVMRHDIGDEIIVFNGKDGEFSGKITAVSKKSANILIDNKLRSPEILPDFTLMFAPIKGHRNDNIIEKATEIGIKNILPIVTERTIVRKINPEKYLLTAIEAAEQCERLNIPEISDIAALETTINTFDGIIFFADEAGGGTKIGDMKNAANAVKVALLIGPEGGFSDKERNMILSHDNVIPISLGSRILRADTACITGLALIQTFYGDW